VASKILVKFLVKNGAAINIKNDMYRTALFYVSQEWFLIIIKIVKYLLDNGADINIKDKDD